MNFDFNVKDWDRNSQIIAGAFVLALVSLFLPWFSGYFDENGLSVYGILPFLAMGYPAYVVVTRSEMKKEIAVTCATVSLATVVYFLLVVSIDDMFDSIGVGFGMFLFAVSAAANYYGVYKYETPVEPKVIETAQSTDDSEE